MKDIIKKLFGKKPVEVSPDTRRPRYVKQGREVKFQGITYVCRAGHRRTCNGCDLTDNACGCLMCSAVDRKDRTNVIFVQSKGGEQ